MFKYECPDCGEELEGSFGDDVYCHTCNKAFETECDLDVDDEGGENHYAWITREKE